MKEIYIEKDLAKKIVMISVTYNTNCPNGGGVSSVVNSYSQYFDGFRHISTWKLTNSLNKAFYFFYHYIYFFLLCLLDWRIKLVHIHAASDASFQRKVLMADVARLFGKKVIFHMHAGEFDKYYQHSNRKAWIFNSVQKCDKVIVLSEYWRNYYIKLGIKPEKLIVLNNIVSMPDSGKIDKQEDGKLHALFLGWLGDKKGVFDLIDVVKEHHEELKGKFYLKLGGRDNEELIRSIIADNHLEDVLSLEGWVFGEKKDKLLEWCNVFILPSYYEALPISILEAMSYAEPIISTPVGGIPEIVTHGKSGFLNKPGDKEALWKSIKFFIDNPEKVMEFGAVSLKNVEPYTPKVVLSELRKIYLGLLNK